MPGSEKEKFQEADPRARRIVLWVLLATILFGSFLIGLITNFDSVIMLWLEENLAFLIAHPEIVFLGTLVLVAPVLLTSIYLYRYGSQVVRQRRYPAVGYSLLQKTRIVEGGQALWRGRIVQICSAAIFCCALAIPLFITLLFILLQSAD